MKCEPAVWEALADHWPRIMKLLRAPEAPAGEWLVRTAQELSTVLEYASLWDRVWFSNEEEEAEGEEEEEMEISFSFSSRVWGARRHCRPKWVMGNL